MYGPGFGWGFGGLGQFLGTVVSVVLGLVGFLIIAGVLVLLIRFLIVGTRAAEVYIAKNAPPLPPPPAPVATPAPAPAAAATPAPAPAAAAATPAPAPSAAPATAAPAAKPPAKPRTPKTPPAT